MYIEPMTHWSVIEGRLSGGEDLRVYIAVREGRVFHVAMDAAGHPCSEDEFLWRIGGPRAASRWPIGSGSGLLDAAALQVEDYMAGRQVEFDLPIQLTGTPFQVNVWQALSRIPFGETRTYGDVAGMIDKPSAMRAVGQANGKNNLPLIVPCHRVVAAGGKIGGFTGGLSLKKALLAHEIAISGKRGELLHASGTQ
jgi:O-6-methylguanine DNA methyltransferase